MAKTAKTAKPADATGAVWRSHYGPDAKVKRLVADNPHRVGSKGRKKWAKLRPGATVRALVEAGVELSYLRYAEGRGLIKVG